MSIDLNRAGILKSYFLRQEQKLLQLNYYDKYIKDLCSREEIP